VAILSSVLNSEVAVQVNITIMRIFTKLRSILFFEKNHSDRIDKFEAGTSIMFKIVFERLDSMEDLATPKLSTNKKNELNLSLIGAINPFMLLTNDSKGTANGIIPGNNVFKLFF